MVGLNHSKKNRIIPWSILAKGAYTERRENPYWQQLTRRLLRFTTAIENIGSSDFRPFIPKEAWEWHACHQVIFFPLTLIGWGFWMLLECGGAESACTFYINPKHCEKPIFFLIFRKFIMNQEKSRNFGPPDPFFHGEIAI